MTTAPAMPPPSFSLRSVATETRSSIDRDAPGLRKGDNGSTRATASSPGTERAKSSAPSVGTMPPLLSRVIVIVPPREIISTVGSAVMIDVLGRNLRSVPVQDLRAGPHHDAILAENVVVQHLQVFDAV